MIVRRDLSKRLVLKSLQKHQKTTTKNFVCPNVRNLTLDGKRLLGASRSGGNAEVAVEDHGGALKMSQGVPGKKKNTN